VNVTFGFAVRGLTAAQVTDDVLSLLIEDVAALAGLPDATNVTVEAVYAIDTLQVRRSASPRLI
jgi:hypothetical protein